MKKTLTRILALVLAMLMVGSLLPVFASAQETQPTDPAPTTAPTDPPETTAAATAPTDPPETTAPQETTAPTQPQVYSVWCYAPDGVTLVATLSAQAGSPVTLPASFAYDGDTYTVTAWTSGDGAISGLSIPAMPEGDVSLTATVQAHVPGEIADPPAGAPTEFWVLVDCDKNCELETGNTLVEVEYSDPPEWEGGGIRDRYGVYVTGISGHQIDYSLQHFELENGQWVSNSKVDAKHHPEAPANFQMGFTCTSTDAACCGHNVLTLSLADGDFQLSGNPKWGGTTDNEYWYQNVVIPDAKKSELVKESLKCEDSEKDAYLSNHTIGELGYPLQIKLVDGAWVPYYGDTTPAIPLTYTKHNTYQITVQCEDSSCAQYGTAKTLINNGLDRKDFTILSKKEDPDEVYLTIQIPNHEAPSGTSTFVKASSDVWEYDKDTLTVGHTPAEPTSFELAIDCQGDGCCGHDPVTVTDFTLSGGISWWPDDPVKWRQQVAVSEDALKTVIRNSLTCADSLKDAYAGAHTLRKVGTFYDNGYGVWLEYINGQWVPYQDGQRPGNLPLTFKPDTYELTVKCDEPGCTYNVVGGKPLIHNGLDRKDFEIVSEQLYDIPGRDYKIVNVKIPGHTDSALIFLHFDQTNDGWKCFSTPTITHIPAEHTLTLKAEWEDENHPLRPASVNFQLKEKDSGLVLDSGVLAKDGGWTYTIVIPQDALDYLQFVQEAPQGYTVTQKAETAGNTTTVTFRNTRNKTVYVYSDTVILKTGQTTWPIPLLTLAGLACLSAGMLRLTGKRKERK